MSPDPIVRIRGLEKTYHAPSGDVVALRSVDADLAAGQIAAIVGASGSGKSTLLRVIAGLDRPTRGDIHVAEANLAEASPAELRRHRQRIVTYVSQKAADNYIPHLTLDQQAHDAGGSARRLLTDVGLADRLTSTPIELSGGEQARGAFALALARETPLLLIDEPTAELDRASAQALLEAIGRHARAGTAIVIATHDPDVIAIADTVLRLDRGRVIGSAEQPVSPLPARKHRAPPGASVLRAQNISKSFERGGTVIHALSRASLELNQGDLAVLLGRSGSGKSTLLALLGGWQQPDTGTILHAGAETGVPAPDWSRLGYLPQRFGLLTELTVRENVELPARLTNRRVELAPRLEHLLTALGLTELANRRPHETSIGQQQRTALARAILLRPNLLIADEPTSHQDAGWRDAVWKQIAHAAAEGTTALIATHEPQAVENATRLWHIDEGALTEDGEDQAQT